MKITIRSAVNITILLCLMLFNGCERKQINNLSSTSSSTNNSNSTNSISPNIKSVEAKKIINDYFIALKDPNLEASNKFCTDNYKLKNINKLKDIKLISISYDVNGNWRQDYLTKGRGSIINPYDAICFKITYNIQYKPEFEQASTEPSGIKEKWANLIKETETSQWKIDEVGD